MNRSTSRLLLAAALALLCSCAAAGLQPTQTSMPLERQLMDPQYRVFYDALEGEGDWTLIEPYGYVFRPHVNFVAWQPYEYGFWVPSDVYGWVWISTEPFGWATYHYGQWMYDSFQGWVWIPGIDWGPAMVTWETTSDYVSWAPLMPRGIDPSTIPGGIQIWAPLSALGSTDLQNKVVPKEQVGAQAAEARSANNVIVRNGVAINRGPAIERVERVAGPLTRVKLAEVGTTPAARGVKRGETDHLSAADFNAQIEATRKAADDAVREAESVASVKGALPPRLQIVRPVIVRAPAETPAPTPVHGGAAPDTARH